MNVKITTAKMKFASGPANITSALCHFGLVSNKLSNCSLVNFDLSSGSISKAFFERYETYPPKGNAEIANSVPFLSFLEKITGPIPTENLST